MAVCEKPEKMSQANVTFTRTVTTSNPNAIVINSGYLKTTSGLLKIAQIILGAIIIGIIAMNFQYHSLYLQYRHRIFYPAYYYAPILIALLIATALFICTCCLLLSCIFSLSTGGLISKTIYEFIYHLVGAILLFSVSVFLYIKINPYDTLFHWRSITAHLCLINSFLYTVGTVLAYRAYRY